MLYDGVSLFEGSSITNATVVSGTAFPLSPSIGELFYRTDEPNQGLYAYDGSVWNVVGSGTVSFDSLHVKAACRAATTTNITLSGTQTIDGVVLVAGNRVLVKNQNTQSQNGVYVVSAGGWSRSADFDGSPSTEVQAGDFLFVTEGTVNHDTGWILVTNGTITIGTTALVFEQFTSGATAISSGVSGNVQLSDGAGAFSSYAGLKYTSGTFDILSISSDGTKTAALTSISQQNAGPDLVIHGGDSSGSSTNGGDLYIRGGTPGEAGAISPGIAGDVFIEGAEGGANGIGTGGGGNVYISGGRAGSDAAPSGGLNDGDNGFISFQTSARNSGIYARTERLRITRYGDWLLAGSAGTAGQALTSNGANTPPTWQTVGASLLSSNNTWTGTNTFSASTFTIGSTDGTTRIRSDFSGDAATRTVFQTTAADSNTIVGAIPNGAGTGASFASWTSTDMGNARYVSVAADATLGYVHISTGQVGAASVYPIVFRTAPSIGSAPIEAVRILTSGAVSFGSSGTATGNSGQVLASSGSGASPTWVDVVPKTLPRATTYNGTTADRGYRVAITGGVTIPASVYAAGDAFSLYNDSGAEITISQGAGLLLRKDGSTDTGNRTLAAYGSCFIWFNSSTEAIINGSIT